MSFTLDVVINPVILFGAAVVGGIFGFVVFKAQLKKGKARVQQLETELMQSNEETLEAQRAFVILESKFKDQQTSPVIPMKITGKDNSKEKASNK
ncbi:MAG TPA: hypothetical protein VG101_07750 [Puia sp.]|jgi:hypothetical protein|nr:hypothetical protein [Puia sp.]